MSTQRGCTLRMCSPYEEMSVSDMVREARFEAPDIKPLKREYDIGHASIS
jgi:hypothetical protein